MSEPRTPSDQAAGAVHPADTVRLFGQESAEADYLNAFGSGRMHHAWLISGPRGVGKATLAWRIARFLLTQAPAGDDPGLFGAPPPPTTLDVDPEHPEIRLTAAGAQPRLFVLRRTADEKSGRLRDSIVVEDVRGLRGFFGLSAADGGHRVVIVDVADELNTAAANALLKLLEEPPKGAVLLLISHQPARLLPTIRSRCRDLRCQPLGEDDMRAALTAAGVAPDLDHFASLTDLAGGSVGDALRLIELDGLKIYSDILRLFSGPVFDRSGAIALAESAAGPAAADRYGLILDLVALFLTRLARSAALGEPAIQAAQGEALLFRRLAPGPAFAAHWAEVHDSLGARAAHGRAVNLDPAALILDMLARINAAAQAPATP